MLNENIVSFWYPETLDPAGGFRLHHDGQGDWLGPADKVLVVQARTVWFFSRLYNDGYGGEEHIEAARHGFEFLRDKMWDPVFGGFFSSYNNKQVTEWLTEARQTSDPAVRQDLYCKTQQQVYWDGYSVPLNFKPFVNAYRNDVIGFHNSVTGPWWLKDVWLDR